MVKSYSKGYRGEREMVYKLATLGYMVVRTPRSGRISLASPDIIAAKDGRLIVIECKSREEAFKIEKDGLAQLLEWQNKAGARAYVAWKISRKGWKFLHLRDVLANNGNIGKKFAAEKGIEIHEI
jgi:Holliday junction resolvase